MFTCTLISQYDSSFENILNLLRVALKAYILFGESELDLILNVAISDRDTGNLLTVFSFTAAFLGHNQGFHLSL